MLIFLAKLIIIHDNLSVQQLAEIILLLYAGSGENAG
jgi:hypothetical protein